MGRSKSTHGSLRILIAGGGIGGLVAALAFRRSGHDVTVFESNNVHNEAGAAIFVAPNCNGLLRRMGVFIEDYGANEMRGLNMYAPDGTMTATSNVEEDNKLWQHPWLLVHRAKLHKAIRDAVTRIGGIDIRLGARVARVDVDTPSITLESGENVFGDIVVGADGIRSECRKSLDQKPRIFDGGHSAFRFLIPMERLEADPLTAPLIVPGYFSINVAADRRLVFYPCDYNHTMNFTVIHPSLETGDVGRGGWNRPGDKEHLLKVGRIFSKNFQRLLELAPEDSLKIWSLLDMDVLDTWIKGNMALLGDAAHPFLPHQGQGGAQAIEDAVSLATCFPIGTPRSEIPERLELYESCRKTRAHKVQELTRVAGLDPEELKKRGITYSPFEFNNYNFDHDEWDHTSNALRRLLWSKQSQRWRSPIAFGPIQPQEPPSTQQLRHTVHIKTSTTFLRTLLPPGFLFTAERGTFAQASLICNRNFSEEGLSGHFSFEIYVHGVRYGNTDGSFLLLSFANSAEAVIEEREVRGAPCLFSDINISTGPSSVRISLAWHGTEFVVVELSDLSIGKPNVLHQSGTLLHRYVPAIGNQEVVDVQYAVYQPPQQAKLLSVALGDSNKSSRVGSARIDLKAREAAELPTLHLVSKSLANLPIYEVLEASVVLVHRSQDGAPRKLS